MFRTFVLLVFPILVLKLAVASPIQAQTPSSDERSSSPMATMSGCLAVANDRRARNIWGSNDLARVRPLAGHEIASALKTLAGSIRLKLGFGTIYFCAQIVASRHIETSSQLRALSGDDRLVIDLSVPIGDPTLSNGAPLGQDDRLACCSIEGDVLVRLMERPDLLPDPFYGGIRLRHFDIDGMLSFRNTLIAKSLAIEDARVIGDDRTALIISGSSFDGDLAIVRSRICGDIRLLESTFAKAVRFDEVNQESGPCPFRPDAISSALL